MDIPEPARRFYSALRRLLRAAARRGRQVSHTEFSEAQVESWSSGKSLPGGPQLLTLCFQLEAPVDDAARLSKLRDKAESSLPISNYDDEDREPPVGYYSDRSIAEQEYVYEVGNVGNALSPEELSYCGVFISYRRADEPHFAGRLQCRLAQDIGSERVFLDIGGMLAGSDFIRGLDSALDQSQCVLVVIGSRWTDLLNGPADGSGQLCKGRN